LRLGDVEVVALGVGCGMQSEEGVGWIMAGVGDGKTECQGVRVEFVRMLKISVSYPIELVVSRLLTMRPRDPA
jgi:hypothetical protein